MTMVKKFLNVEPRILSIFEKFLMMTQGLDIYEKTNDLQGFFGKGTTGNADQKPSPHLRGYNEQLLTM